MDRRLLLPLMVVLGCAEGSLEGPGSFGLPNTSTMTTQSDTEDDDGETEDETEDGDGDGEGDTGPSTQSSTAPTTADDGSTSTPVTTAEDSSEDDSASLDDSASASAEESSSSSDPSASASNSDDGASMDDGVEPPPDAAAWEDCEAAVCDPGNDCITVTGVVGNAYCAPQCVTDLDCPFPDTGDATPFCLLVGEDAVDPTNCALVCEVDGLDYGTCPNGMTCTSVPGQDPTISLCMW